MGEAGGEVKEAGPRVAEEEPAPAQGPFQQTWLVLLQQAVQGWQVEPCVLEVGRQVEEA